MLQPSAAEQKMAIAVQCISVKWRNAFAVQIYNNLKPTLPQLPVRWLRTQILHVHL